ncbi:MAG: site-specific integrase [Bacteroides sp.]
MARKTIQNVLTSPEKLAQVNIDNSRLAGEFLLYLKSIGRAETTISAYENDLNIFWCYLLEKCGNKSFVKVSKRDLVAYQYWLAEENKNSPARIRRLKSSISSLSNYVENILDDDEEFSGFRSIVKKIENPINEQVREKTIMTDEQISELLASLVRSKQYQKACAVALAVYSGARKAELLRFKPDYFVPENIICGSLYKTPEKMKTKGRGSGKFIYKYVLVNNFKTYYDLWMEERARLGIECDNLFVRRDSADGAWVPASIGTLNSWASTFSKMLGVDFYWHSLRHYFTTHLSEKGIPDTVIQEIVGWESTEMCHIYIDTSSDEKIGSYFDENGIKDTNPISISDL